MDIGTIIQAERQRYVDFFLRARAHAASNNQDVVGELLIAVNDESLPYPYRYIRADLVSKGEDGKPQLSEIRIDPNEASEPKVFRFGSFQVHVYPFSWNSVQILFDKLPVNVKEIEDWIIRWLDVDDVRNHEEDGLSGAIHSFTQIENDGKWWFLTADLGTAPGTALIEFVELLASQGMGVIVLKSG